MASSAAPIIQTHAADGGLTSCFARVKPELVTYMKDVLKMESLQDFFFYVAKDAWEAELDVKVVKPAVDASGSASVITEAMKPIQLARVRMAWQSAAKVQNVAEASLTSAGSADDPLPETARQLLDQRWKKRYPEFAIDPALMGASAIIHQKMRTALAERFQGDKLQIVLGDATLTVTDYAATTSRVHFRSVSHFYLLHRTLTNCWAYVGTAEVESKNHPGTQVLMMSFQQALGYSDTILRKAVDVPESAQLSLAGSQRWADSISYGSSSDAPPTCVGPRMLRWTISAGRLAQSALQKLLALTMQASARLRRQLHRDGTMIDAVSEPERASNVPMDGTFAIASSLQEEAVGASTGAANALSPDLFPPLGQRPARLHWLLCAMQLRPWMLDLL
ncbi:aspC [Symbiodinium sp. CCMP2592]|nr:aspC [Symbiodinium sp. CCMP2592]